MVRWPPRRVGEAKPAGGQTAGSFRSRARAPVVHLHRHECELVDGSVDLILELPHRLD